MPDTGHAWRVPRVGLRRWLCGWYRGCMCKPINDYLALMRDYTREIITFGGFCLMCFVYGDFKALAQEQSATSAQTVEVLRSMDSRLTNIEHQTAK